MALIKMIWDFKGPNAKQTAAHHLIHLKEFATIEGLDASLSGTESISQFHEIAFLAADEALIPSLRKRLKPTRGQYYKP